MNGQGCEVGEAANCDFGAANAPQRAEPPQAAVALLDLAGVLSKNDLGGTLFFNPPKKIEGVQKPGGGFLRGKKFFGGGLL